MTDSWRDATDETVAALFKRNPDLVEANQPQDRQVVAEQASEVTASKIAQRKRHKSDLARAREYVKTTASKMGNVRTRHYASKKEARYADELALRQKAGEISFWLEQVPFRLPGNSVHRLDFMVFTYHYRSEKMSFVWGDPEWNDYTVQFVEIKGRDLPMGKLKRRQVEELYGIYVEVV